MFNYEDNKNINKNATFRKLLQVLTACNLPSVRKFLKHYNLELTEAIEQEITDKIAILEEKLKNDESSETTEEALKNITDNAKTLVYTFLCAAIETTWTKFGADINTQSVVKTAKILKQKREEVRENLYYNIDENFKELNILIASIVPEPKDGLEEIINNVIGFK